MKMKTNELSLKQNLTDFKIKTVTRDIKRHYIMIKGSIQRADIAIVNYLKKDKSHE